MHKNSAKTLSSLRVSTITEEPEGTGMQSRMLTASNKISQTYMALCLLPFWVFLYSLRNKLVTQIYKMT